MVVNSSLLNHSVMSFMFRSPPSSHLNPFWIMHIRISYLVQFGELCLKIKSTRFLFDCKIRKEPQSNTFKITEEILIVSTQREMTSGAWKRGHHFEMKRCNTRRKFSVSSLKTIESRQ